MTSNRFGSLRVTRTIHIIKLLIFFIFLREYYNRWTKTHPVCFQPEKWLKNQWEIDFFFWNTKNSSIVYKILCKLNVFNFSFCYKLLIFSKIDNIQLMHLRPESTWSSCFTSNINFSRTRSRSCLLESWDKLLFSYNFFFNFFFLYNMKFFYK